LAGYVFDRSSTSLTDRRSCSSVPEWRHAGHA
jgi:hypothetical protein